ncbi:hypothetical protein DPMN_036758 [Dreissena polymorpha]|uniref:Amine oxidase n=1 Tax=Dreissena polymorpha TaxID=45954 RepID=A0A9D4ME43_DREPO|nr:hypothetical protein DPMN_036758 [Dreissena polymorpha]
MQPPDVIEYKVGPLNALTNMVAEQLIKDGVININRRPNDEMENYELFKFINITLHVPGLDSLLRESFDSASFGNNISVMFYQLPTVNANERISHMNLYLQIDDEGEGDASLRLLPISCFVHHAGTNVANWKASDWYYASQGPFYSSEDLNDAYGLGTLRMVRYPKGYIKQHTNEFNVRKDDTMPERDFSNIPPPRTYTEHGKRYKINGYKITYLGWQFEFSLHPVRGPVIYDIRFKEHRIAYEISLQDITLLYHPGSNGYGPLTLTDTAFLLGTGSREPRPGLDCPKWGNILDVNGTFQWYHVGPWAGVCVFEADGQRALWRHRARGMVDYFLVVRTILTLGNYDYVVEWEFHVDGRIETMLTASGYLFGSWDDGLYNSSMFGFRIGDFLLGPIHDHTYSFKVDIDVLGIQNSFQTLTWEAGDINAAFQSDDRRTFSGNNNMFYFNQTRFIRDTIYQNETSVVWNPHQPKYYMVVNERERNKWGSLRGYRIVPYSTEQEILKDHPLLTRGII